MSSFGHSKFSRRQTNIFAAFAVLSLLLFAPPAGAGTLVPLSGGFQMTAQFENNSCGYADDQIYVVIMANDGGGTRVTLNPNGSTSVIGAGDNASNHSFTLNNLAAGFQIPPTFTAGRMYISYGQPMDMAFLSGGGVVQPNLGNPGDPNYSTPFDIIEFTVVSNQAWFNTSQVDNLSIPMTMEYYSGGSTSYALNSTMGITTSRTTLHDEWIATMPAEWQCLRTATRIHAPAHGCFGTGGPNQNYFQGYIDSVWAQYSAPNSFNYNGWVGSTGSGQLCISNGGPTYCVPRPNTQEVFLCSGPLAGGSSPITPNICAAFNRGVAHNTSWWDNPSMYYPPGQTANYYAGFLHERSINNRSYGFAYDDVNDQSTTQSSTNPRGVRITIGAGCGYTPTATRTFTPVPPGSTATFTPSPTPTTPPTCGSNPTLFHLHEANSPAGGDSLDPSPPGGPAGFFPTVAIGAGSTYFHSAPFDGLVSGGTYSGTLWTGDPGAPVMLTVDIGYADPDGSGRVSIGSTTINTQAPGNHPNDFTIAGVPGQTLNNKVWSLRLSASGGSVVLVYNPNDIFDSRISTPSNAVLCNYTPTNTPIPPPTSTYTRTRTPTFTSTGTDTVTVSPTNTLTATASRTASATPSGTNSPTSSVTATSTWSATRSATRTVSPTRTPTATDSYTPTPVSTQTVTLTPSATASSSNTATASTTLTASPSATLTATRTVSRTASASPSRTGTVTHTTTVTGSNTPGPSATASPTITATPTATSTFTATPTVTPTSTLSPIASATVTLTASPTLTATSSWTATPTATSSRTATPSATVTLTATSTRTATSTVSATPTASPPFSPTLTATASPTATQTGTVVPTGSPSPGFFRQESLVLIRGLYPNPFAERLKIYFTLRVGARVEMRAYNVAGEVITLDEADFSAGKNIMEWDGANQDGRRVASGVYLISMHAYGVDGSVDAYWERAVVAR